MYTGTITHPAGGAIGHLVFAGCENHVTACHLESPTIETPPLKLEAALGSKTPEDTLLVKPESGTKIAEFGLEGEQCTLAGKKALTGQARFIMPKGREELASQPLEFHANPKELRMGSAEVFLGGTAKVKLATAKTWSFR